MIYTVFSTSHTPYMNWQSELLEYSWKAVEQKGRLIRLVATSSRRRLPRHVHAKTIATSIWDIHPITGDFYPVYNKPASLLEWLSTKKVKGTILLMDPDCVFRAPVNREVLEGRPISQTWLHFNSLARYGPARHDPPLELIKRYCRKNRKLVQGVMIPTLIHTTDLRRILPRWLELTGIIREEVRSGNGHPLWESDMYGYVIAAAECGLVHEQASLGICTNWSPHEVAGAPIIHYCHPIRSTRDAVVWSKRTYRPWKKVSNPRIAAHEYGRDLLAILNSFVDERARSSMVANEG